MRRLGFNQVDLTKSRSGHITEPFSYVYIWGEALVQLEAFSPNARIIKLETAIESIVDSLAPKGCSLKHSPDCSGFIKQLFHLSRIYLGAITRISLTTDCFL